MPAVFRFAYTRLAAGLACTALALSGCTKGDDVILIGEVGSTTGPTATFGQSTHKGIALAADQVNAAGGINGKKLRVKLIDDQGKPEEAQGDIKALIDRDHAVAILGEVATSVSLAMAPIAQEKKVPMISPSSTGLSVTQVGDYIFRVCFIDPFQGFVMAKFAKNTLPATKVAILKDTAAAYSTGLADAFNETFQKLGGQVLLTEGYHQGDVDFRAQLTKIKAANPDAVFVPGYYSDVGLIAKQAREIGLNVPLLGGDGWDSPKLYEIGGPALEGSFFSNHYSVDAPDAKVQAFIAAFKAKNDGEVPDAMSALGYDAMGVLVDAMKRAKDTNGSAVKAALAEIAANKNMEADARQRLLDAAHLRDAIAATANFEGITGTISIDKERNATKPAVVLKIKNGKYDFVTRVAP